MLQVLGVLGSVLKDGATASPGIMKLELRAYTVHSNARSNRTQVLTYIGTSKTQHDSSWWCCLCRSRCCPHHIQVYCILMRTAYWCICCIYGSFCDFCVDLCLLWFLHVLTFEGGTKQCPDQLCHNICARRATIGIELCRHWHRHVHHDPWMMQVLIFEPLPRQVWEAAITRDFTDQHREV